MAKGKKQDVQKRAQNQVRSPGAKKHANIKAKRGKPIRPNKTKNALAAFLTGTLLVFGGGPEWVSTAVSIGLLAWLFFQTARTKELAYPRSFGFIALCLIPVFAALALFYAVDRGEALLGAMKFLSLPIFAIAAVQEGQEKREQALEWIPPVAAGMTVVSAACAFTPAKAFFFQADRLGGFFQAPNTYGLFLLIAIVILCHKPALDKWKIAELFVCIVGIILTGSRSIFVMLAVYLAVALVVKKSMRKLLLGICATVTGGVALALILTGNVQSFGRILTAFGQHSTFWGRMLYARDALPMLEQFPMGMGYRGYYFAQGSFQTGDYAVMHVHNELLQCALDFGIPCGICLVIAIGISLFSKRVPALQRTILILIVLHSLFDFDLQFLAMDMILILCMDLGTPGTIRRKSLAYAAGGVLLALQIYGFFFLGLEAIGAQQAAIKLYPGLTLAQAEWMQWSQDWEEREQLADKILSRNHYCAAAYKIKAENAAQRKDFTAMERYARQAIKRDPYNDAAYKDYIRDISLALDYYVRAGNRGKVLEFLTKAANTDELMRQAEARASALAFKIKDRPTIELPDEYNEYLKELESLLEHMEKEGREQDVSRDEGGQK